MAIVFMTGFDWTSDVTEFPFLASYTSLSTAAGRYSYGRSLHTTNPTPGKINLGARFLELYLEFDFKVKYFSLSYDGNNVKIGSEDSVDHYYLRLLDQDGLGNMNFSIVDEIGRAHV